MGSLVGGLVTLFTMFTNPRLFSGYAATEAGTGMRVLYIGRNGGDQPAAADWCGWGEDDGG